MKKVLLFVVLAVLMTVSTVIAQDMGVQVIGPEIAAQTVGLDDMKLGEGAEIDGWGTITLTDCKYIDYLNQFRQGKHSVAGNWDRFESGLEADYLLIQADILNTTKSEKDYLSDVEVKVVFDDDVEYAGWYWQYNWDNGTKNTDWAELNGIQNKEFVITKADQFNIGPYYTGHYCFGCTLPNAVVSSKKPLRMEITMDGNELTYYIRK